MDPAEAYLGFYLIQTFLCRVFQDAILARCSDQSRFSDPRDNVHFLHTLTWPCPVGSPALSLLRL